MRTYTALCARNGRQSGVKLLGFNADDYVPFPPTLANGAGAYVRLIRLCVRCDKWRTGMAVCES